MSSLSEFRAGLLEVSLDRGFTWRDLRVLLSVIGMLGFRGEWKRLGQREIGKSLGIGPGGVSHSVRRLIRAGIIERATGRRYRISPYFGCKVRPAPPGGV